MYIYRYMSRNEMFLMSAGVDIEGKQSFKARTSSSGVCFLPEEIPFKHICAYDNSVELCVFDPRHAYEFLAGIVSRDVLVRFSVEEDNFDRMFSRTHGVYADPFNDNLISVPELCTPYYNRDMLEPVGYCVPSVWEWWDFH